MWLVFLLAAHTSAQLPLDPPLARRPTNFSQLTGRFTIAATVEPTEAIVEDPITLRIVIQGDVVRGEPPLRKHLRIFPGNFAESFYLEPAADRDKARPNEKAWEFFWKLRAKSTDVGELPSLALSYYSVQGGFQTARSEPIAITIKERPKIVVELPELRSAPASLLELAAWSDSKSPWRAQSQSSGMLLWLAFAIVLAVGSWQRGGVLANRAATQRLVKESRLCTTTVAELRQESADLAAVVTRFLQARFSLAAVEPSSADVIAVLKRHGVAKALRDRWVRWYGAVAARRFAPMSFRRTTDEQLTDEAIALIRSVEARS